MIHNHHERFARLQRLRAQHRYGIPEKILAASVTPAKEDKDSVDYVRQTQPEEILGHLTDIPQFDLRENIDLGSTPPLELQQRYQELEYRAKWLEALLNITREEMQLFEDALNQTQDQQRTQP